jgi:hypothetical protein
MRKYFEGKWMKNQAIFIFAMLFLLVWAYLFLSYKINLNGADLGRHLKNGEIITSNFIDGNFEEVSQILRKNVYSYTYPDYDFINHHWLSGVVFFIVEKFFGFWGLSFFHFLLKTSAFFIIFYIAYKETRFYFAFLAALIAAPLIGNRYEVRPEDFTYFFMAILILILYYFYKKNSTKFLFIIPLVMFFWVNANAYFIFGHYLLILFILVEISRKYLLKKQLNKKRISILGSLFLLNFLASLINPSFLKGALYPFLINNNISISISELLSVFSFLNRGEEAYCCGFISIVFGVVFFMILCRIFLNKKKEGDIFYLSLDLFFISMFVLYLWQIRNIALMGYVSIFVLARFFYDGQVFLGGNIVQLVELFKKRLDIKRFSLGVSFYKAIFSIFLVLFIISFYYFDKEKIENIEINRFGINSDANRAAEFFVEQGFQGPIFNDFGISSYLIYYLYPKERMYIDQRPEAFPADFQKKAVAEIFDDENIWKSEKEKYGFRAIFLKKSDSSAGQEFISRRKKEDEWKLAHEDEYSIIFVKEDY